MIAADAMVTPISVSTKDQALPYALACLLAIVDRLIHYPKAILGIEIVLSKRKTAVARNLVEKLTSRDDVTSETIMK